MSLDRARQQIIELLHGEREEDAPSPSVPPPPAGPPPGDDLVSRLASFAARLNAIELRLRQSGEGLRPGAVGGLLARGQDGAEETVVAALPQGTDLGEASRFQGLDMGGELG